MLNSSIPEFDPEDYIGIKYVLKRNKIDTRAEVKECNEDQAKFLVEFAHGGSELLDYDTLINSINKNNEDGYVYHMYGKVLGHKKEAGKLYAEVLWDTGEITWEPINTIKKDDPVTLTLYAKEHDLIGTTGWKWARKYMKNNKKFVRTLCILKAQKN